MICCNFFMFPSVPSLLQLSATIAFTLPVVDRKDLLCPDFSNGCKVASPIQLASSDQQTQKLANPLHEMSCNLPCACSAGALIGGSCASPIPIAISLKPALGTLNLLRCTAMFQQRAHCLANLSTLSRSLHVLTSKHVLRMKVTHPPNRAWDISSKLSKQLLGFAMEETCLHPTAPRKFKASAECLENPITTLQGSMVSCLS